MLTSPRVSDVLPSMLGCSHVGSANSPAHVRDLSTRPRRGDDIAGTACLPSSDSTTSIARPVAGRCRVTQRHFSDTMILCAPSGEDLIDSNSSGYSASIASKRFPLSGP